MPGMEWKVLLEKKDYKNACASAIKEAIKNKKYERIRPLLEKFLSIESLSINDFIDYCKCYNPYLSFHRSQERQAKYFSIILSSIFDGSAQHLRAFEYRQAEIALIKSFLGQSHNFEQNLKPSHFIIEPKTGIDVAMLFNDNAVNIQNLTCLVAKDIVYNPAFLLDLLNLTYINGYDALLVKAKILNNIPGNHIIKMLLNRALCELRNMALLKTYVEFNNEKYALIMPLAFFDHARNAFYASPFATAKNIDENVQIKAIGNFPYYKPFIYKHKEKIKTYFDVHAVMSYFGIKKILYNYEFMAFLKQFYIDIIDDEEIRSMANKFLSKPNSSQAWDEQYGPYGLPIAVQPNQNNNQSEKLVFVIPHIYDIFNINNVNNINNINNASNIPSQSLNFEEKQDWQEARPLFRVIYKILKKELKNIRGEIALKHFVVASEYNEYRYLIGHTLFFAYWHSLKEREKLLKFIFKHQLGYIVRKFKNVGHEDFHLEKQTYEPAVKNLLNIMSSFIDSRYEMTYPYIMPILLDEKFNVSIYALEKYAHMKFPNDAIRDNFIKAFKLFFSCIDPENINNREKRMLVKHVLMKCLDEIEKDCGDENASKEKFEIFIEFTHKTTRENLKKLRFYDILARVSFIINKARASKNNHIKRMANSLDINY